MYSFIETKLFSRLLGKYLSDDEYAVLQRALIDNPEGRRSDSGIGCRAEDTLGRGRKREARRAASDLLCEDSRKYYLDADDLSQERD